MKTCPTCQTPVFDDMPRCFSCLFNFEEASNLGTPNLDESFLAIDEPPSLALIRKTTDKVEGIETAQSNLKPATEIAPLQTSQIAPTSAAPKTSAKIPAGEWLLRLEIRSIENPAQICSMELSPTNWSAATA